MKEESGLRIAVIGAGVAGIVSAWLLQRKHQVSLYEKNDYLGGHTHTIVIDDGPDAGTPVDTGFIVLNDRTYPMFNTFLSRLGVTVVPTDMCFSYYDRQTGYYYGSSDLNTLFAQRSNLLKFSHWRLLYDILRFNRKTLECLRDGTLSGLTLGDYLTREAFGGNLVNSYLIPMAAAIWSTPDLKMMEFPAESFFHFFENHGLLTVTDQPQWQYVKGGSHTYVKAFLGEFDGTVMLKTPVKRITRGDGHITVTAADDTEAVYDCAVIATHADQVLRFLSDPSPEETRLLSPWRYMKNRVILHTDVSLLPPNRRAWASWNYIRESGIASASPITLSYHMNRLQKLKTERDYCVTLNPVQPVDPSSVIREMEYDHPMYTFDALATQKELSVLNGTKNTYYCGSYFGYGFHEDAVRSAVAVSRTFGINL